MRRSCALSVELVAARGARAGECSRGPLLILPKHHQQIRLPTARPTIHVGFCEDLRLAGAPAATLQSRRTHARTTPQPLGVADRQQRTWVAVHARQRKQDGGASKTACSLARGCSLVHITQSLSYDANATGISTTIPISSNPSFLPPRSHSEPSQCLRHLDVAEVCSLGACALSRRTARSRWWPSSHSSP